MRWVIKDYSKLHHITRKYLCDATPNDKDDYMRAAASKSNPRSGDYLAIAMFSGRNLIGWAMLDFVLSKSSPCLRVYVFVKPQYRRRGYGTLIMKKAREAAKRRDRDIRVCPWNHRSKKFFQAVKVTREEVAPGYALYKE